MSPEKQRRLLSAAKAILEALDEDVSEGDPGGVAGSRLALNHAHADDEDCIRDEMCPVGLLRNAVAQAEKGSKT